MYITFVRGKSIENRKLYFVTFQMSAGHLTTCVYYNNAFNSLVCQNGSRIGDKSTAGDESGNKLSDDKYYTWDDSFSWRTRLRCDMNNMCRTRRMIIKIRQILAKVYGHCKYNIISADLEFPDNAWSASIIAGS